MIPSASLILVLRGARLPVGEAKDGVVSVDEVIAMEGEPRGSLEGSIPMSLGASSA